MSELVIQKGGAIVAAQRLWLTSDRARVVSEGDPEAAYLLAGCAGQEIPRVVAEALGLVPTKGTGSATTGTAKAEAEESVGPMPGEKPVSKMKKKAKK